MLTGLLAFLEKVQEANRVIDCSANLLLSFSKLVVVVLGQWHRWTVESLASSSAYVGTQVS